MLIALKYRGKTTSRSHLNNATQSRKYFEKRKLLFLEIKARKGHFKANFKNFPLGDNHGGASGRYYIHVPFFHNHPCIEKMLVTPMVDKTQNRRLGQKSLFRPL